MAFLYSNENFPRPVVEELRNIGHEIVTIRETGKSDKSFPDEAVLEFAVSHEMTIITLPSQLLRHIFVY